MDLQAASDPLASLSPEMREAIGVVQQVSRDILQISGTDIPDLGEMIVAGMVAQVAGGMVVAGESCTRETLLGAVEDLAQGVADRARTLQHG